MSNTACRKVICSHSSAISVTALRCPAAIFPEDWKSKLICQAYDRACEMGGALQVFMGCVPNAHYIHCFAHQLSWSSNRPPLTFLKGKNILLTLLGFSAVSPQSPKCIVLDKILTPTLPTSGNDRWNLYSWAINTMFENIYCFENIVTHVTLTPVPLERMKPWPCCWIVRTLSSFRNLLSHHVTRGPPLCQVLGEEHFITIIFSPFWLLLTGFLLILYKYSLHSICE